MDGGGREKAERELSPSVRARRARPAPSQREPMSRRGAFGYSAAMLFDRFDGSARLPREQGGGRGASLCEGGGVHFVDGGGREKAERELSPSVRARRARPAPSQREPMSRRGAFGYSAAMLFDRFDGSARLPREQGGGRGSLPRLTGGRFEVQHFSPSHKAKLQL